MKANYIFNYGILVLLGFLILSCNRNGNEGDYNRTVSLKAHDKRVRGYLDSAFAVVDSSYQLQFKGNKSVGEATIKVRIRSTGRGDIREYSLRDGGNGPLYLTICDSTGRPVRGFDDLASEHQNDAVLKNLMSRPGSEARISFQVYAFDGRKLPRESARFIVSSRRADQDRDSLRGVDSVYYPVKTDWDQIIDGFEQSVDEYARLVKDASRGDTVARKQYASRLTGARATEEVLVTARTENELTERQIKRVIKIQDRLVEVAAEIHKVP